jgi:hypothetical protein
MKYFSWIANLARFIFKGALSTKAHTPQALLTALEAESRMLVEKYRTYSK